MSAVRTARAVGMAVFGLAACVAVFGTAQPAAAFAYSFQGSPDGEGPVAGVISDASGALYGTTVDGGISGGCEGSGCGIVFQLSPPTASGDRTESVLYSFTGGGDGGGPSGNLIFDASGALYGTTVQGGTSGCGGPGCGTVFKLTPPATVGGMWTETVLYSFTGGDDGSVPYAGLIFDAAGALYGTTAAGGNANFGTVFKLTPPATSGGAWTESVLYSFAGGADGAGPVGSLIFDASGALYGTTQVGGVSGCGSLGCGTVFRLTPPATAGGIWTESVLYRFTGGPDGGIPLSGLIFDALGALYGTTLEGGNASASPNCGALLNSGCGTVFKLTPPATAGGPWTETVLYAFAPSVPAPTGGRPLFGSLIFDSLGALYGTTLSGGVQGCGGFRCGTLFKLTPPATLATAWTETVLSAVLTGPTGTLIFDASGALYGTADSGGGVGCGGVGCGSVFGLSGVVPSVPLSVSETGLGVVTSVPSGISCGNGGACSADFAVGATTVLTAVPASGWSFAGWSGACSGSAGCIVAMTGAQTVTATFTQLQFSLALSKLGRGVIGSSPGGIDCGEGGGPCIASFPSGTAVQLVPFNKGHWTFLNWGGACIGSGACVVTMNAAASVTARFGIR